MCRARMFLFKQLKCSIILSGPVFFSSVLKQSFLAATYFGELLDQITYMFTEIRSSVTDFREENKMDVCCLFKSLVSWWATPCSFDRTDRSQSIEIVPPLSCCKNITWHKSLWQSQDVKSKVDLIPARVAMIYHGTKCQNHNDLFITSFIPWSWFCVQGVARGVGSLQRFQSIETSDGNGVSASFLGKLTAEEFA